MEAKIQLDSTDKQLELFGPADSYLKLLRDSLGIHITARQGNLIITGKEKDVNKTVEVIDRMQKTKTRVCLKNYSKNLVSCEQCPLSVNVCENSNVES